jgi:hypothetical protein
MHSRAHTRYNRTGSPEATELTCHYYYTALAAQLGRSSAVACEVGENGNSINAHYAFTRGAARQFQVPWMVDFSAWMAGFITDYSTTRPWGSASSAGGDGGHSLSLFKRAYYLAYTQGAAQLVAEAGAVNYFYESFGADGVLNLSPLGVFVCLFFLFFLFFCLFVGSLFFL